MKLSLLCAAALVAAVGGAGEQTAPPDPFESGVELTPHTRIDEFESAIRSVCEPIFEKPLKEISFGQLLLRLFQTARRFNMEVQPQLVLLQKTLLNIEGLGRQLYPDLDLWKTAKPFLEQWMSEQVGARAMLRSLREDLPYLIEKLPEMPGLIYNASKRLAEGDDFDRIRDDMQLMREQMARNNKRSVLGIVATGLIVSALLLLGMADASTALIFGLPAGSWISGSAGILILVYVLYSLE